MATPRTADAAAVRRAISDICAACHAGQIETALTLLNRMIPEFEHNTGRQLAAEPARSPA